MPGLIILGMAANEWRSLKTDDYRRFALAAGIVAIARTGTLLLLRLGWTNDCLEWILQGLTLTLVLWAYLYETFSSKQRASTFLAVVGTAVGLLFVGCAIFGVQARLAPPEVDPWPLVPLLLSGAALLQWLRHRQQFSLLLGLAFLISLFGATVALLGLQQIARLTHLAFLVMLAIETYRAIIKDLSAYGDELQAVSDRALRQTQNMAFLLEVSQAIGASLDLSVVLERISEAVARAVNADWAYILLPTEGKPEDLAVAARYGWWGWRWTQESQVQRQATIHVSDFSLLRHAILRRRQVLANQPEDYEQFERLHALLSRPQSGPTLIQPLFLQNQSLGAMLLGHVGSHRVFSEADGKLCQALVGQVATAIENARLYQSVDEQAQRLADLLRTREIESTQRQAILESIADGVIVAGQAGEVVLANAAAERILDLSRQQLMEQTIKRLYTQLLKAGGKEIGDQAVFEWDHKIVMGSLAPVKMPGGDLLGYVAVFRDVTRERQAEQAKSDFIATVSHELRTPMTSIKGYVELLTAGAAGPISAQQQHFLGIVATNTERMISLVNNLITVSEMERGPIHVRPRPVDMVQVIKEAMQAAHPHAESRQLELTSIVPPDLSPARGDPECLRQIMDNLLDNALCYTPPEGRVAVWATEAHLEEAETPPQHFLVISIRDTGVGIPPEEHDKIFEKFYRVENPLSLEAGGTGMGLAIVKSLVTAHQGRIWVESEPGEGSTFSFTIPAAKS